MRYNGTCLSSIMISGDWGMSNSLTNWENGNTRRSQRVILQFTSIDQVTERPFAKKRSGSAEAVSRGSIPGDFRIDGSAPLLDAPGHVLDGLESAAAQGFGDLSTAAAVVTVDDDSVRFFSFQLVQTITQLAHRNQ